VQRNDMFDAVTAWSGWCWVRGSGVRAPSRHSPSSPSCVCVLPSAAGPAPAQRRQGPRRRPPHPCPAWYMSMKQCQCERDTMNNFLSDSAAGRPPAVLFSFCRGEDGRVLPSVVAVLVFLSCPQLGRSCNC
jgi:hypothetical protein